MLPRKADTSLTEETFQSPERHISTQFNLAKIINIEIFLKWHISIAIYNLPKIADMNIPKKRFFNLPEISRIPDVNRFPKQTFLQKPALHKKPFNLSWYALQGYSFLLDRLNFIINKCQVFDGYNLNYKSCKYYGNKTCFLKLNVVF